MRPELLNKHPILQYSGSNIRGENMKMFKRYFIGIAVFLICLSGTLQIACADIIVPPKYSDTIEFLVGSETLYVNQKASPMDVAPFIFNDRSYVPVRSLLEAIGVANDQISWDPSSLSVKFPYRRRAGVTAPEYMLRLSDPQVYINGTEVAGTLDAPPIMRDGRIFVPVRFVAEFFGCSVSWNAGAQSVTFNAPVF